MPLSKYLITFFNYSKILSYRKSKKEKYGNIICFIYYCLLFVCFFATRRKYSGKTITRVNFYRYFYLIDS